MKVTEALASYVVESEFENLTGDAIKYAKLRVLDSIGCGLGGSLTDLGKVTKDAIDFPSKPESTLIADNRRISCRDATFVNSILINALDFDDNHISGHPSSTIVPAALAVGEQKRASGTEILTAITVAYEICTRIGVAMRPSPDRAEKVWGIGTHQVFGAVAAAGKLLGLDMKKMLNAFGIAGAIAPLPSAMKWGWDDRPLTWVKDAVAFAALQGVHAALLAEKGFIGCRSILDGKTGFWVMAGSDRCNFELMTKDLGKDYEIVKGDFKYYPCCKYIQPTLDAIRHIITENHLQAEDIQSILVKSIRWLKTFEDYEPTNMVDAEFSVPYTAAMVILGETPGPNWYLGEKIRNKKALNIARKVRIEVDPAAERIYQETEQQPSTVEIATKDGRKFDCHIDHSKGEYYNPLTPEELESKFRHNASFVLKEEVIKEIIAIIRKLEQISDINELTALLSSNP